MTTYIALLRGINVGGSTKLPMADLRAVLTELGHTDVRTHLNSGNALFTAPEAASAPAEDDLAKALSAVLADRFGRPVPCLVRSVGYLRRVVDANPYDPAGFHGSQMHVTFLSEEFGPRRLAAVDPDAYEPDDYRVGERALYLLTPNGMSKSPLADALARPALLDGAVATTRTWNTTTKLLGMTDD